MMNFPPVRSGACLLVVAAMSWSAVQHGRPSPPEQLEPGRRIEREIEGPGDLHTFNVDIPVGHFFQAHIDTRGMPLAVSLLAPEGVVLARAAGRRYVANLAQDQGRLLWIADRDTTCRLEVRADPNTASPSRYELYVPHLRPAASADYEVVAGEQAIAVAGEMEKSASWRDAISRYQEAASHLQAAGEIQRRGEVLDHVAVLYEMCFEPELSLKQMLEALAIWRELGDRQREASELSDIAGRHRRLGNWQEALDFARQALSIGAGDLGTEFLNLTGIGETYRELGEPEVALDFLNRALLLRAGQRPVWVAETLGAVADAHAMLGDTKNEIEYRQRVVDLWHDMKVRGNMEALALNSLAEACASSGLYGPALEHLGRALQLYTAGKSGGGRGRTLNNIGSVYLKLDQTEAAREAFSQAMDIWADWGDWGRVTTLAGLAEADYLGGDMKGALDLYGKALDLWRRLYDWRAEAKALRRVAEIESELGNHAAARRDLEAALEIIESARGRIAGPTLRGSYHASQREFYESYIDLLMRMHSTEPSRGYDALALEACERARSRSLLELLTEARVDLRRSADPGFLEQQNTLAQQIRARHEFLVAGAEDKTRRAVEARTELESLLVKYHETEASIRATNPRYAALVRPRPLRFEELQQLLDSETLVLEYWLGEKAGYLWAVGRDSLKSYVLPDRALVEAAAQSLRELLVGRQSVRGEERARQKQRVQDEEARYRQSAQALSRILIRPAVSMLWRKRLVIVADGRLYYLPFSALPVPDGDRLLIHDHEIVNLPSFSALAALRERQPGRNPASKQVAVFADPVFEKNDPRVQTKPGPAAPGLFAAAKAGSETVPARLGMKRLLRDAGFDGAFPRLMGSREEARTILAADASGRSVAALDFSASRGRVLSGDLKDYRILHLATHGLVNEQHPELSGLILSLVDRDGTPEDGFLTLHDIYDLQAPSELVVLSACNTALGKQVWGEGLVGLTQGFFYAGADRVLATLWKVDDEAAAAGMSVLYRNMLVHGMSPAAALRSAQIEMLQTRRWHAPYYWAAFVMQGAW